MAFTLTPAYSWSDGDLVTAVRLASTATPTLANDQTYTFAVGSAAAPAWNFTGYTTTGIYAAAPGFGFTVAGASVGTWTATGIAVTGYFSATDSINGNAGNSTSAFISTATTGWTAYRATNTGGNTFFGVEASVGGTLVVGSTAYDALIRTPSGLSISVDGGSSVVGRFSSTGLALASGVVLTLGNAYQAGAPTSTGYITIKDSTGTTYKIPASV